MPVSDESRRVAGLMSGTSLDGVDCVVASLTGSGRRMRIEQEAFSCRPYPDELRSLLFAACSAEKFSVADLSQLNVRLAHEYADAVRKTIRQAGLTVRDLDLVGSHGQTIRHVPEPALCAGLRTMSSLQIGDPSTIANLLGITVVGDFRLADMAFGGQGAPLVPYFDWVRFASKRETRVLLNLGGIANLTVLPAGGRAGDVIAFDTGPANLVVDHLARHLFDLPYDDRGTIAAAGRVDESALEQALSDSYFALAPPKSTGRERFGAAFAEEFARRGGKAADLLATATELTARSIHAAYVNFVEPEHPAEAVIVSGGGRHNAHLTRRLSELFRPVPVRPTEDYGVSSDAKEALCFAVLAHETLNGVPTNMPRATGAARRAILGKICLPTP